MSPPHRIFLLRIADLSHRLGIGAGIPHRPRAGTGRRAFRRCCMAGNDGMVGQCDKKTGTVISPSSVRVTPPNTISRALECP